MKIVEQMLNRAKTRGGEDRYAILLPTLRTDDYPTPPDEAEAELRASLTGAEPPHDLLTVTTRSPAMLRKAVWRLARYFQREFRYDFVQYSHGDGVEERSARAYLWLGSLETNPVIGACCFRWREWNDHPAGWALQWIWFHPYERRRGHLAAAWPYFRARFGDFFIEPPVSESMRRFAEKAGDGHLLPRRRGE